MKFPYWSLPIIFLIVGGLNAYERIIKKTKRMVQK